MVKTPQVEDGYTRLANEIIDAFALTQLSGYQWRCMMFLIRKTYGWGKLDEVIPLSQWVAGTGISKAHVCRTLLELEEKNIITKTGNRYSFQKDSTKWPDRIAKTMPRLGDVAGETLPLLDTVVAKTGNSVAEIGNNSLPKLAPQKDSYKETILKAIAKQVASDALPDQIRISLGFHQAKRDEYPGRSLWLTDKDFVETVARGAVVVERMFRLSGWEVKRLEKVLRWCLKDKFYMINLMSLNSMRKPMDGGLKIENAEDRMKLSLSGGGSRSSKRTPASGDKDAYASKY